MLTNKLMGGAGAEEKLYVDDVFSTYLYTGNGSTQTITNGIDLAGEGGLVWTKHRTLTYDHWLQDTARGVTTGFITNGTSGNVSQVTSITAFNSNGYTLGNFQPYNVNSGPYVSWTFRKAPKFFDVVTYTGNGVDGRTIAHSLGVAPGMIIVKCASASSAWNVYHRSTTYTHLLQLNNTNAAVSESSYWSANPSASVFTVGGGGYNVNDSSKTYVAYLFAHDTASDGMIQCGSYTTNAYGLATITLGWEPQYILFRRSATTDNWTVFDTMRGFGVSAGSRYRLRPNTSEAEATFDNMDPTATGFYVNNGEANTTYIYLAIRRPNKPPTSGTEVYVPSTSGGVITTGFPVDLHLGATLVGEATNHRFHSRLQGGTKELVSCTTAAESTVSDLLFDSNTGLRFSFATSQINHFFRRAPGFFDVVCYTGTGSATTVAHSLGAVPELIIVKSRSTAGNWPVYHTLSGATKYSLLNLTNTSATSPQFWNDTTPTVSVFTVGVNGAVNTNAATYVAYLFATLAGISKVGSYTGNGSSQTINCGFSAGARFVLIKRTDGTGDWYVWDSVRGIVAANDPHLSLNTTVAEVTTDDSIDPDNSGFIVNQVAATNINVTSATYIFLAIA